MEKIAKQDIKHSERERENSVRVKSGLGRYKDFSHYFLLGCLLQAALWCGKVMIYGRGAGDVAYLFY